MNRQQAPTLGHRLFWLYTGDLEDCLDAATWLQTTQHLRALGWQVRLVSATSDRHRQGHVKIDGVDVERLYQPGLWALGQLLFHAKVIRLILQERTRLDAILFHEMSALWLLPLRWLGQDRPRLVMDTRTLFMAAPSTLRFRDRLRAGYLGTMQWLGNQLADGRLCITEAMAESCRVPADKHWGSWPSGVEPAAFTHAARGRRWPHEDGPVELIYVGVLHKERCLSNLCEAVMLANATQRRFRLTLIGEGTERPELEVWAAGSDGSIRLRPPIPHAEIPLALQQAHVGTLPFPDEEKFRVSSPIKLFEYLACGLPLLATRIRCHTDVLGNPDFAFWSNTNDVADLSRALDAIWRSRHALHALGRKAAQASPRWSWEASAQRLSTALASHLGQQDSAHSRLPTSPCVRRR